MRRSARRSSACIVCSMMTTVTPLPRTRRIMAIITSTPSLESPARGSSRPAPPGALAPQRDVARGPASAVGGRARGEEAVCGAGGPGERTPGGGRAPPGGAGAGGEGGRPGGGGAGRGGGGNHLVPPPVEALGGSDHNQH